MMKEATRGRDINSAEVVMTQNPEPFASYDVTTEQTA
jgi:hypothetical protein